MEESSLMRLDLRSPLVYTETSAIFENCGRQELSTSPSGVEWLLCFELDPVQGRSIEPEREHLPGALLFTGRRTDNSDSTAKTVALPAGIYLFTQRREFMEREEWLDMAIEQQKDGLWERFNPESRLYVRFLFEDGKPVTQLFRPIGS